MQIAEIFGVTDRSIRMWAGKGCPREGRGKWNVRDVLAWWLENIYKADEDTNESKKSKDQYWDAKARTETVKADVAEKESIKVKDFMEAWVWRLSEMSNGLGAIPMRISPLLAMKTETECRSILDMEIWKIRDKFARTGKFTPASSAAKKKSAVRKLKKKKK